MQKKNRLRPISCIDTNERRVLLYKPHTYQQALGLPDDLYRHF